MSALLETERRLRLLSWRRPATVLLGLWILAVPAHAQSVGASVTGIVSDESGARLPNTTVTITHLLNGRTVTLTTGTHGDYRAIALLPGDYELASEHSGFSPVTRRLTLLVGADAQVNLTLPISGVDSRVTVTGEDRKSVV